VITHPRCRAVRAVLRARAPGRADSPGELDREAVRVVVDAGRREQAALGTTLAASIYGGSVIREGVEDRDDNATRFAWLARSGGRRPPAASRRAGNRWKVSLVFGGGPPRARAGSCAAWVSSHRRDINLTKIESRPRRRELGSYISSPISRARRRSEVSTRRLPGLADSARGACARLVSRGGAGRA